MVHSLKTVLFPRSAISALANLASLILLGVVGAYWTLQWMAPRAEPRSAASSVDPAANPGAAMGLFGGSPSAAPSAATAGNAIRLAGVVAAEEGRDAYAVLVLDGKEIVVTLRGEEITQGIRLAEVAPGHVVLERHGIRETLVLPEKGGAAENAGQRKDR